MMAQQWLYLSGYLTVTRHPKNLSGQKATNAYISPCNVYCVSWQLSTTAAHLHTMIHHCTSITNSSFAIRIAVAEEKREGFEHRAIYVNLLIKYSPSQTTWPRPLQEGDMLPSFPTLRSKETGIEHGNMPRDNPEYRLWKGT